jgi:polyhydroxyalkanoate synthesis regulator phasin
MISTFQIYEDKIANLEAQLRIKDEIIKHNEDIIKMKDKIIANGELALEQYHNLFQEFLDRARPPAKEESK